LSVTLFGLAGCSSLNEKTLQIQQGDPKDRVIAAMGSPEDRQFDGRDEAWQYGVVATMGLCEYTIVWFRDGTVRGLSSYRARSVAGCRAGLRSIRWEEAPTAAIEIRQR
jgi:hypothetical protein